MIILRSVIAGLLRDPGTGTRVRRIGGAVRHAGPIDAGRSRWAQSSKDRPAGEAVPPRRDRAGHRPCDGRPGGRPRQTGVAVFLGGLKNGRSTTVAPTL